ncbi:3-oxoacyl-[acyl-carrier protein] reductase [Halovenus aranensis]|uniref:3-oxoacyl-[acyl-carrier protein] reductase n=1 Tax=Halovenus aranensis TaxID=890420 RepID=A0A1G8SRL9_9EURY|nr:3-oxoacyl-ACP reductase family protein [Halovenus aranensis]SDJ31405.1 3-oxoacyl-[acyl-carrier protein] reductase [Halovenus aranensis]
MPAALVTGSSRGLGRATALRFAKDGYDVAVNYHTSEQQATEVAAAVREHGQEAIVIEADVSVPEAATRLVEKTVDAFGGLDHVVNNAGIDQHVYTENLDSEDFDRIMDVNVNSAFNVTKAALSYLEDSADDPSVTNISSILAHTGAPIECHYASSKGALISLTRSHATDFAPDIRVNAVAPGHIETDMTADRTPEEKAQEREGIPVGHFGEPEDIAGAVAYLRDATFVTGETLNVNGGEDMR